MIEALHDFMPAACQWNVPHGGFFVWMTLPAGHRRQGDAAARGHRPGRLRAGDGVLRRRLRLGLDAAVVLLPHARADPRGRTPPGRRPRGGDGAARDLRRHPRPPTCPAAATTAPERTSHDRIPSSCSPAASPTSATSRCARADVRPRRCGPPASRWPSATWTPVCSPPCSPTRPRAWCRCCTARAARTARSARSSTCSASRTSAPARPPAAPRSTSRSPSPWSRASASPRRRACACRTRRSASSAPPQVMDAVMARLGLPIVVKPARSGSALGCTLVESAADLPDAMVNAFAYGVGGADRARTSPAPRSRCPSSTTAPARGRCPRWRSSPTGRSTTTPLATPPAPRSSRSRPSCPPTSSPSARGWPSRPTRRSACATCRAPT